MFDEYCDAPFVSTGSRLQTRYAHGGTARELYEFSTGTSTNGRKRDIVASHSFYEVCSINSTYLCTHTHPREFLYRNVRKALSIQCLGYFLAPSPTIETGIGMHSEKSFDS